MEIYGLLAAGVLTAAIGAMSLFRYKQDHTVRFFFATMVGSSLWALGIAIFLSTEDATTALYASSLYYSAAALIALMTCLVGLSLGRTMPLPGRTIALLAVPSVAVIAVISFMPHVLMEEIGIRSSSATANTITLAPVPYAIYALHFLVYFGSGAALMVRRAFLSRKQKRQYVRLSYMAAAYVVAGVIGAWFNLMLPWFDEYRYIWVGPLGLLLFVPIVYIAIVKYGLFDIRTAVVRSVAYALSLGVLAVVYFGLAYLVSIFLFQDTATVGVSMSPANIVLALVLAFIFQPIKQFFDWSTDRIFFRNRYNSGELISHIGEILTSTTHLRTLLEKTSEKLQSALKASYVVFHVHHENKADVVVGAGHVSQFTVDEAEKIRTFVDGLGDKILIIDEAVEATALMASNGRLLRMLQRRRVALLIPLSGQAGYLMLGEALNGSYTQRDLRTLGAISDELVIAIQNARSVQEVRDLNMHLQRNIDNATQELRRSNDELRKLDETKDEFVSMASHQLRTPLTSIKGYLSMVLEGDMGEVNAQQRKVLGEAFSSSERMVRLIGDFLNVSRLQTGKFIIDARPTDLAKVIGQEIDSMQQLAESHGLMLVYKRPKKFPMLDVDEDKLRQVVMNFVDNAIYYSRAKSTIVVKAYVEHGDAIVEVHDSGIGVPKAEQERLFTKFFRAENARRQRPDGTGVGLFLARKVVTALGGEIIFSSTGGKGNVFGFPLPVKKLEVKK